MSTATLVTVIAGVLAERVRVEPCALVDDCTARDPRASAARGDGSGPGGHRRDTAGSARATGRDAGIKAGGNATVSAAAASPPGRSTATAGASHHADGAPAHDPPPELRARRHRGPHADRRASARPPRAHQAEARHNRSRGLNAGQRTDYDSARRFLAQTEAAVKENNLLLAESSVEKAETLADGLR